MFRARRHRLLLSAVCSLAVLVPAGLAAAACPPRPLPPCQPTYFTAEAGKTNKATCTRKPPSVCRDTSSRRGLRGLTGKTGAAGVGIRGATGLTGAAGARGATGASGTTGVAGPQGTEGVAGLQGARGDIGADGVQGIQGTSGLAGPAGADGVDGAVGAAGADGADGADGIDGATGLQGVQGEIGADGTPGTDGSDGSAGADGAAGADGPAGPAGADGTDGNDGQQGPAGADGADGSDGAAGGTGPAGADGTDGAPGPAGPAGGLAEYAYIYNTSAGVIALEADVPFGENGYLTAGITHDLGNAGTVIANAGIYKISFSLSGVEPNQMALFLNGSLVQGSVYGSGSGTQLTSGEVIVAISANDVITLRNHTSSAAVTLQTLAGGTQENSNASLTIEKIG